jgi:hypothetical protein
MCGVIGFVYVKSCQLFCNLTDMHQKPSACFGLCMGMVPEAYQCKFDERVGAQSDVLIKI